MYKLSVVVVALLLVAGCSKHNFTEFPTGSDWPTNVKAEEVIKDVITSTVETNLEAIDAANYAFGTVAGQTVKIDENGVPIEVNMKDIKKKCAVDLSKKLKLGYENCAQKEGCIVSFSVAKSCGFRPLFVIKTKFTKDELAKCKVPAYLTGVYALREELGKDEKELTDLVASGVPEKASFLGYLLNNKVEFTKTHGKERVIGIHIADKQDATKICLDNFLQKSAYIQDTADKFLKDDAFRLARPEGSKGSMRKDGKAEIAVFKAFITL